MMSRTVLSSLAAAAVAAGLVVPLSADVKTRERTQIKFEGLLGGLMNRMSGQGSDGFVSTVAVHGDRKSSMNDRTGQIIDLAEKRVYEIDVRRKEYRVTTFDEMRERLRKAQAEAEQQAKAMPEEERQDLEQAGREIEIDLDVRETGATRSIAGHTARQVIITVTLREKGRTVEDSGGMILATDTWLAPRIAALDEIHAFDLKYFEAVYGDMLPALAQLGAMAAMYPGLQRLMARSQEEAGKLDGTPLATTMTVDVVRSTESLAEAQPAPTGGGLSGRLARRVMGGRGTPQPRSTLFTSIHELQAIETSASATDVAVPQGFRERR
jgi:hypothetical protein